MTAPQTTTAPTRDPGLGARVIGVITSPRSTFEAVAARPRWLGVLALVVLVNTGALFAFMSTEVGQQAMLDQQVRQAEARGVNISDQQYANMERMLPMFRYIIPATSLIVGPIFALIIAGLLYAIFNAGLGGEATFKQVFAVVAHAGVITILGALFIMPFNYWRKSMASPTNLGVFVPMLEENSFPARVLGIIDLMYIWWIVVLAIGLAVLYRRRVGPIATSLLGVYAAIALVVGAVMSFIGGS